MLVIRYGEEYLIFYVCTHVRVCICICIYIYIYNIYIYIYIGKEYNIVNKYKHLVTNFQMFCGNTTRV